MCIIGHSWEAEEAAGWSTDASVLRAWARDSSTSTDDATKVERHMIRLARSRAAQRGFKRTSHNAAGDRQDFRPVAQKTKYACRCGVGKYGMGPHGPACRAQLVTDIRIRVIRGERTDQGTGEIRAWKDYRVGYYTGGNGFLSVNDGRVTARDIARVLGGNPHDRRRDYALVS